MSSKISYIISILVATFQPRKRYSSVFIDFLCFLKGNIRSKGLQAANDAKA
jgi:hypothetical protein